MMPEISPPDCQIKGLVQMSEPLGSFEITLQLRHKVKRIIKRRLIYVRNWLSRSSVCANPPTIKEKRRSEAFEIGQTVRVRSREEIQDTLDNWNHLKGCAFMEEMWSYCGSNQRVLKPVRRFVDERDHQLKKTRGIVFLEGVNCQGTIDYGRCDRNCYYFWREEWLEKVD